LGLSGAKTKLSYVECIECGDDLKFITVNHLKRHGLTSKQYRERHPKAQMVCDDTRRRQGRKDRQWNRICRKCGDPFTTKSPKGYYCRECQRLRRVLQQRSHARRYERKKRNSGIAKQGTFGKRYLKIEGGRIRGAVLLEEHIGVNSHHFYRQSFKGNGKALFEYEAIYLITIYLVVWKGKVFCGECGSQLTVARENEYYTIPVEVCCRSCGLVFELDDLMEIRSKKDAHRTETL